MAKTTSWKKTAGGSSPPRWTKIPSGSSTSFPSLPFYCEGATFADLNNDGIPDAISGPYWYEGPDFKKRHEIYPAAAYDGEHGYSENFFAFAHDFNGDGWIDILVL